MAQYIETELQARAIEASKEKVLKAVAYAKTRSNFVSELWQQAEFYFVAPTSYDEKTIKKRWKEQTPTQMTELLSVLEGIEDFSSENTEQVVISWIEKNEYNMGGIMNPFRLAIVGEGKGPHMFDITEAIGKEETITRLRRAIDVIK